MGPGSARTGWTATNTKRKIPSKRAMLLLVTNIAVQIKQAKAARGAALQLLGRCRQRPSSGWRGAACSSQGVAGRLQRLRELLALPGRCRQRPSSGLEGSCLQLPRRCRQRPFSGWRGAACSSLGVAGNAPPALPATPVRHFKRGSISQNVIEERRPITSAFRSASELPGRMTHCTSGCSCQ